MKALTQAALVAIAFAMPAAAFADSSVTHDQLCAELAQLEQVGYQVSDGENTHYPEDILAAEARLAARNAGGTSPSAGAGGMAPAN